MKGPDRLMGGDCLIVRWAIGEIRILRNNLFAISNYMRRNRVGVPLDVFNSLRSSMDTIVSQLTERYEAIYCILLEHQLPHLWQHLDLF